MDSCLWATAAVLLASNAATQIATLVGHGADADSSDTRSSSHASRGMPTADLCRREDMAAGSAFMFSTSSVRRALPARAQRFGPRSANHAQVIDDNAWTAGTTADLLATDVAPTAERVAAPNAVSARSVASRIPEVITAAELGFLRDASSVRKWQSSLAGEKRFAAWTTDGTPGVDTRATWNGGDAENEREIQTMPTSFGVKNGNSGSGDVELTPPTFNGRVIPTTTLAPLRQDIAAADVSVVPEPGTWMLMASGLLSLAMVSAMNRRKQLLRTKQSRRCL